MASIQPVEGATRRLKVGRIKEGACKIPAAGASKHTFKTFISCCRTPRPRKGFRRVPEGVPEGVPERVPEGVSEGFLKGFRRVLAEDPF